MSRFRESRRLFAARLATIGGSGMCGILPALSRGDEAVAEPAGGLVAAATARDPVAGFERTGSGELAGGRWIAGVLTSQTWQGLRWRHELALYRPEKLAARGPMVLWIDGGTADDLEQQGGGGPPEQVMLLATVAESAGLPAAVVRQVPFQPIDGRFEDDLIAHTFVEFFRTGDAGWPLLVPMVKAAVAAMDAASAEAAEAWDDDVDSFVVTGASKRGWTTWLTAAADRRVTAIAPMVIDMLDLPRHMRLQMESFGGPSDAIRDYTSRSIHTMLDTPRGRELLALVDPYCYREQIRQPKLILLGTNDQYWPLEACGLYFPGLCGDRWLSYVPNATHGLPLDRVLPAVAALGRHAAGTQLLPRLEWEFACEGPDSCCRLASGREPRQAWLWTADSASRDFRESRWQRQRLEAEAATAAGGVRFAAEIDPPADGLRAALAECRFRDTGPSYSLTTGVRVLG